MNCQNSKQGMTQKEKQAFMVGGLTGLFSGALVMLILYRKFGLGQRLTSI